MVSGVYTAYTGYGLREFHRLLDGPAYARRWRERAEQAGVDLRTADDRHRLGRPGVGRDDDVAGRSIHTLDA